LRNGIPKKEVFESFNIYGKVSDIVGWNLHSFRSEQLCHQTCLELHVSKRSWI